MGNFSINFSINFSSFQDYRKIFNLQVWKDFLIKHTTLIYLFYFVTRWFWAIKKRQQIKNQLVGVKYAERDLNPHTIARTTPSKWRVYQFHHPRILISYLLKKKRPRPLLESSERKTGLEPATLTLARLCSTNWATFAFCDCKDNIYFFFHK